MRESHTKHINDFALELCMGAHDFRIRLDRVVVVHKHEACEICHAIEALLAAHGFAFTSVVREKATADDFSPEQLVITVGGDGTVLSIARFLHESSLLFTVNSNPKQTEGFLTRTTYQTFKRDFARFLAGKASIASYPRIQASINGKPLPYTAINEVSITRKEPYTTLVFTRNRVEKATGILVGTGLGSTAWMRSAGGTVLPRSSTRLQFLIREPYSGNIYYPGKRQGFTQAFTCTACTEGIIVNDSVCDEFPFKSGDLLEVRKASTKIHIIEP